MAPIFSFFFFNDTATTEIYTLSLHDALPIFRLGRTDHVADEQIDPQHLAHRIGAKGIFIPEVRSEEHTSELQSQSNLVCRLLLEKKKKKKRRNKNNNTKTEYQSIDPNTRTNK